MQLVSIIIPCYNAEKFIFEAITSALDQTYQHVEVIVIDDGSKDNSLELIQSFGNRVRCYTGENQGVQLARNKGLQLAKGAFVKFLDADDVLYPDCLERQVKQANELPEQLLGIVFGDAAWVGERGEMISRTKFRSHNPDEDPIAYILEHSSLTSCPLHRRDALLKVGGFDPELHDCHENDLHLRLTLVGFKFIYHPCLIYKYRQHTATERITNQARKHSNPLAYFKLIQKHQSLIEESLNTDIPASIKRALARKFWRYGRAVLREGHSAAAREYFQSAQELDHQHCIVGQSPYPALVKWLGPYRAEAVLTQLKQLKLNFVR